MAFRPEIDFATALADTDASFTLGTNVFAGSERAVKSRGKTKIIPDQAVFCLQNGGRLIEVVHQVDAPADNSDLYWPRIECVVRSKKHEFETGRDFADLVRDNGHKLAVVQVVGGLSYMDCLALLSGPTYLVEDDTEHHRWLIEFELPYEKE